MSKNNRTNYYFLPEKYQEKHDMCEFLITQIESFITDNAYSELKYHSIQLEENINIDKDEHILDFLLRTKGKEQHDKIILASIIHSTIIDICYFVQEALLTSLKQRLTVTFALLRKPFVYDLVILLRAFFTDDFIDEFNSDPKFDATKLAKRDLKELLSISTEHLTTNNVSPSVYINANELYDFIFNKAKDDSLINITNKALHPSTTYNENNLTGVQNLNFFFSTKADIETQWDYVYRRLPYFLLYMNELIETIMFGFLQFDTDNLIQRIEERAEFFSAKE